MRLLLVGCVLLICLTGCRAQSDVGEIAALVPAPLERSAIITEILERTERLLDSNDDPKYSVSRRDCRELLAQTKARYGDIKSNTAKFEKQFQELEDAELDPAEKENAFGMILLKMSQAGLAPEAAQKAEAHSSPMIRAIAPYILGRLQIEAGQYDNARQSFIRALTKLKTAPESHLKRALVNTIIQFAWMNGSMADVILIAENCVPKAEEDEDSGFVFAQAWCKVHKNDLTAGKFEPFLKRAEAATDDQAKANYVRAVIKEQMKRGNFADVSKTIDRIFPPGAEKKKVAADVAAIFGRFDGRDLCLETWAIVCTQYGKLTEAKTIADSIEELKRRDAAINKMIGVLIGKDVKATVLYGLMPDTILGGDAPDEEIPAPKYSEAELLKFCRWYAATAEQQPYTTARIKRTASAAGLMSRFGFKKEANELFDKAFAGVLAVEKDDWHYAVEPIITHRIGAGDVDAALELIEKLAESGAAVPVYQKISWLCAMEKFDDALALADQENKEFYLGEIANALVAADRKEDARKIFKKIIASESQYLDVGGLLQLGMVDEAFQYIERYPNATVKAQALMRALALQQLKGGSIADTDKTKILLEVVKQVEKMDAQYDGDRHKELERVLNALLADPKIAERLLGKPNRRSASFLYTTGHSA